MDPDLQDTSGALDWSGFIRIKIQRTKGRENGPGLDQPGSLICLALSLSSVRSLFFSLRTPTLVAWILLRNAWFKAQKLCFVVLIMNPPFEFANPSWGDVDRGFCSRIPKGFGSIFVQIFSKCFCMLIRWFTTIDMRCEPWNLEGFPEEIRVLRFWTKTLWIRTDLHRFGTKQKR